MNEQDIKDIVEKYKQINGMHLHILPEGFKPILIVKVNGHISKSQLDEIGDRLKETFEGKMKIIVTTDILDVSVFPVINVYPEKVITHRSPQDIVYGSAKKDE